jgi:hypothetical protein
MRSVFCDSGCPNNTFVGSLSSNGSSNFSRSCLRALNLERDSVATVSIGINVKRTLGKPYIASIEFA